MAAFLTAGCNKQPVPAPAAPAKEAGRPSVTVARPVPRAMTHRIDQPGEVRAYEEAPMFARISGYVERVNKDYGERVEAGEVLAELSVPEMREELKQKSALTHQADAEVIQARRLLAAANADVLSAKAKVTEAEAGRARTDAELRRAEAQYARLKKSTAVLTQEQIEELELTVKSARASVAEVEAKVGSAKADVTSKEAKRDKAGADITVAEAHLDVAKANEGYTAEMLKYAQLRAPFAGIVTRRNIDRGHFLQAVAGKTEPAFIVARTDLVRVTFDVPEDEAVLINDGMNATVSIPALKGEEFSGSVERTAWSLDAKGGRTLRTEIELKNDGRLRPGMYVTAALTIRRDKALAVPAAAIVTQGDQAVCFLVEGGKAVRTPVRTGFRDAQFVELLYRRTRHIDWVKFTGDEDVVVTGAAGLTDGQAVDIAK